jgi:POT family proton-dependent oligopeptide transporter
MSTQDTAATAPAAAQPIAVENRFPPQIRYIIGNEGCERFSFYGMKNVLTFFLINYLLTFLPAAQRESTGKAQYHLFVSACYLTPLLGGYLADRFLGKYRTIFWLSILYCFGHFCLAVFIDNPTGFYAGLGLIALGTGGIKPCISSFVGDQFTEKNKHLVKHVFALFYWIINFGSFFASLLIPKTLEKFGAHVAFAIPGLLMVASTVVLWAGRKLYVDVPPTGRNPHSFLRVMRDWYRGRLDLHPAEAVDGAKAVLRVMLIFAPIPVFWALWDQKGSTWIVQATQMDLNVGPWKLAASQLMALNPLLVMLIIPLNNFLVYPAMERAGVALTPLRRMAAGMAITGLSFAAVGLLQARIDSGATLSVLWQSIPYVLLTVGEVLVSTTGLEFAYTQAPRQMKGTIMSFWNLTVTVGNLFTAGIAAMNVFKGAGQFFFFAVAIFLAAGVFALLARRYVVRDYFQKAV